MSVQFYWKRVIFSDETQVVVGHDRRVHVWRKADVIWRPECVGLRGGSRVAVMFWGCITFDGVDTLTEIEGNMKHIGNMFSKFILHTCHFQYFVM